MALDQQNYKRFPQQHHHARRFHDITVNDDKDNDDETWFEFRPFPADNSFLSSSVSFDNSNFENIVTSSTVLPTRTSAPRNVEDDDDDNFKSARFDDDYQENEDEEKPAEVSISRESDSVYSGGISCSGSFDSNRIELIQLEEDDDSLVQLTLDCRSMDEELASEIFVHLRSNTHLNVLRLKCGGGRKKGASYGCPRHHQREEDAFCKIVSALKYNVSIEHLEINGELTIDRDVSSSLASSLADNSKVHSVVMKQCKFVGSSLAILVVAMQHMKQIRRLCFHSCDWEEHNAETIASSLPYLNLHSLSLDGMNIVSGAWNFLLRNIQHSKNLVQLDLSRNTLEQGNVRLLTKSLTMSKNCLETLTLSRCGLTYPCAKEISMGLREYHSLTSLDISHNPRLTDKSAIYFKDLIKYNRSITKLQVHNCNLSQYSLNAIDSGLRYNNSILKTFLSETASLAIFEVVDIIGKFDMLDAVPSFGGSNFASIGKDNEEKDSVPRRQTKKCGNNETRSDERTRAMKTRGKENTIN